ncbi:MAG: C-terminal target protein, partial [Flavipsychrobacter sp.]|nr:C-terminal target protein [Flavipsychrobacter sp.]
DFYLHVRSKCNSIFTSSAWSTVALRTGSTGIENIDETGVRIYPNPATDLVHIEGAKATGYSVVGTTGQTVQQGTIENELISIEQLPAGIYILKLDSSTRVYRLIKQ